MNRKNMDNNTAKGAVKCIVDSLNAKTPNLMEVICMEQLEEQEKLLFIKMTMPNLHKNGIRVFALAETESELLKLNEYIEENYPQIEVVESATVEEHGISEDMLLNRVNGTETDCIVSVLNSSLQDDFIERNKALLNTRMWIGFSGLFNKLREEQTLWGRIKKFFVLQSNKK